MNLNALSSCVTVIWNTLQHIHSCHWLITLSANNITKSMSEMFKIVKHAFGVHFDVHFNMNTFCVVVFNLCLSPHLLNGCNSYGLYFHISQAYTVCSYAVYLF